MTSSNETPKQEKQRIYRGYWAICLVFILVFEVGVLFSPNGEFMPLIAIVGAFFAVITAPIVYAFLRKSPDTDFVGFALREIRNEEIRRTAVVSVTLMVLAAATMGVMGLSHFIVWMVLITVVTIAIASLIIYLLFGKL